MLMQEVKHRGSIVDYRIQKIYPSEVWMPSTRWNLLNLMKYENKPGMFKLA